MSRRVLHLLRQPWPDLITIEELMTPERVEDDESEPPDRRRLPDGVTPGRRTPDFTASTVPLALLGEHRTTVWARLEVSSGTVDFIEGDGPAVAASPDHPIVILPDRFHRVAPSTDAVFAVQFFDLVD